MNASSIACTFPGQGSQMVGMGRDAAAKSATARAVFDEADTILGFKLSGLCFEGPEAELNDTVNTQPALLVTSIAVLRSLEEHQGPLHPAFIAGHSVGELTALVAAGALTFADGVRLVRARGEAMKAAGAHAPGGMAAILNLDVAAVEQACAQARTSTGGVVQMANDNCPGQVVISGDEGSLEKAMTLCKAAGAKRALRLAVSIAAHSALMHSGLEAYAEAVAATPITAPNIPVISNLTALPLPDVDAIRAELPQALIAPVRWTETIRYLRRQGVTTFYEIGSKDVLTGLLKRIDSGSSSQVVQ
jgi:[acyl-carrier-protein] S-malonyltransferase